MKWTGNISVEEHHEFRIGEMIDETKEKKTGYAQCEER